MLYSIVFEEDTLLARVNRHTDPFQTRVRFLKQFLGSTSSRLVPGVKFKSKDQLGRIWLQYRMELEEGVGVYSLPVGGH